MPAALTISAMGGEVSLAMPIGALEEVAKHNPRLGELCEKLASADRWTLADINTVLDVGLIAADGTRTARELIEHEGAARMAGTASALLRLALNVAEPDRPKAAAAMQEILNSTFAD